MDLPHSSSSLNQSLAIDEICERFEDALRAGLTPQLEDFVPADWLAQDRSQLVEDLLSIEIEFRAENGQTISTQDYLGRFPGMSAEIEKVVRDAPRFEGPRSIGPYRIVEKIGAGGMGTVYKAIQPRLNRFVAIKVLPVEVLNDPNARLRFDREMQAVGKVAHPNIVCAFDAGHESEYHYLVMELVEGFSLAEIARRYGQLDVANACELIRQAALGLAQVHHQGLVHRDIKPANLMLGPGGQVKVLDLGLALLYERLTTDEECELTNKGQLMGTLDFMAPEQCVDSHTVDPRADIYSLGATLFRLLAGRVPFSHLASTTAVGRLAAKLQEPCPALSRFRTGLPAEVSALVEKMLDRRPENRPATAEEVAERLAPYCRSANVSRLFESIQSTEPLESSADTANGGPTLQKCPAPESPPAGTTFGSWPWLLGLALAAIALGIVFYWPVRNGTIRVEINDPEITATISGEKLKLHKSDWDREISLSPGARTLLVERGNFRFSTNLFELRAGDTLTLRVEMVDGKVVVRDDHRQLASQAAPGSVIDQKKEVAANPPRGKPPLRAHPTPTSSDFEIFKYLRRIGAGVSTDTNNETDPQLKITAITWPQGDDVADDNLAPLSGLRFVEELALKSQRISSEGFSYFRNYSRLKRLDLAYSAIDAEGVRQLANYPELERLQTPCVDADAWVAAAVQLPKLNCLHLYRCDVTDEGLKSVIGQKQLRHLIIGECGKLTPASLATLEQMKQLKILDVGKTKAFEDQALIEKLRQALPGAAIHH